MEYMNITTEGHDGTSNVHAARGYKMSKTKRDNHMSVEASRDRKYLSLNLPDSTPLTRYSQREMKKSKKKRI